MRLRRRVSIDPESGALEAPMDRVPLCMECDSERWLAVFARLRGCAIRCIAMRVFWPMRCSACLVLTPARVCEAVDVRWVAEGLDWLLAAGEPAVWLAAWANVAPQVSAAMAKNVWIFMSISLEV